MRFSSDDVAHYYDRNTKSFLARGEGGREGAIHRAVWGEGVASDEEAIHFVHELILREIGGEGGRPRILDLGCGVGASLFYLLRHVDGEGFGISNSRVHVEMARRRTPEALAGRVTFTEGDFANAELPSSIDLAFGIESFVQGPGAERFFAIVARVLRPAGKLILCDDFLVDEDERWVPEFRKGWRAGSLATTDRADTLASSHGLRLQEDRDLTPYLELDRPRDRAIALLVALGRPLGLENPRFLSLLGGNALRQCLKRGLVRYRFRVWQKSGRELS